MARLFNGTFPKGVSVGAVVTLGDVEHLVLSASGGSRSFLSPYFLTMPLVEAKERFEKNKDGLGLSEWDSHQWYFQRESKGSFRSENSGRFSGIDFPDSVKSRELTADELPLATKWQEQRQAVLAGVMPGYNVAADVNGRHSPRTALRSSQILFDKAGTRILHYNAHGERLDHARNPEPSAALIYAFKAHFPQEALELA